MNLLDKKKSIGALALGLFLFISCEKNGNFGLDSDDIAPVQFSSTDIPVTSSVVWLDSIISSGRGTLLVGEYTSSTFGKLTARGFSQLDLNGDLLALIPSESEFDSVKVNLKYNYVFDTSRMASEWGIDILNLRSRIQDTIHITSDGIRFQGVPLGNTDLMITDLDSIFNISIDQDFGKEIYDSLKAESAQTASQEAFEDLVRGIGFSMKAGVSDNIFGIEMSESSNITLYYRDPGVGGAIDLNRQHAMTFHTEANFYQLFADRSGTPTAFLTQKNVEYDPGTGKRYVQAGAGIVTKIDISAFRDFITDQPRVINLAEFTIGPIDIPDDGTPPPGALFLALTDNRNTLIDDRGTFRTIQADGNSPIGSDNPLRLIYDAETRTYTGSITTFIQAYFNGNFQRDDFFIYPTNMNRGVNGVSFDAEDIKLKIIFSELQ